MDNNKETYKWTVGIVIAIVAILASIYYPEIRDVLGLNENPNTIPTKAARIVTSQPSEPTNSTVSTVAPDINPQLGNFQACSSTCTGNNSSNNFAEGIDRIYIEYDYANIPSGADYSRVWSMNGQEWIRYNCSWDGSSTGTDAVELKEPLGLYSGTWQMSIYVNGDLLMQENIVVIGNHTYWDPVSAPINRCR